jgi:hypothetical protein
LYPGLPSDVTKDEITIYGENGVLWWRGLATEDDEAKVCAWAKTLQERLGVRRIIGGPYPQRVRDEELTVSQTGHTPNFEEIVSRCNGEVVVIDTGSSPDFVFKNRESNGFSRYFQSLWRGIICVGDSLLIV